MTVILEFLAMTRSKSRIILSSRTRRIRSFFVFDAASPLSESVRLCRAITVAFTGTSTVLVLLLPTLHSVIHKTGPSTGGCAPRTLSPSCQLSASAGATTRRAGQRMLSLWIVKYNEASNPMDSLRSSSIQVTKKWKWMRRRKCTV